MDIRRLGIAEVVGGLAAIALFIVMFLDWYRLEDATLTGWQAFSVIDVVLVIVAAVAVLTPVLTVAQPSPALPLVSGVISVWLGMVAMGLLLFKILNPPGTFPIESVTEWAYVGLGCVVVIVVGG